MTDVVIVLSTVPDDESAETIARALVQERLVACANLLPPMTSIYHWQGAIERDAERQLVMKTTRQKLALLEQRLKELHTYELPEFLVLSVDNGNPNYLAWVARETEEIE